MPTPVYGAAYGGTTTAWSSFTFIDRSITLPPGATVTQVGLHNLATTSARPKVVKEITNSQYEVVQNESMYSHGGTGFEWATLSSPYSVPSDGFNYRVAWWVSGTISRSVNVARAFKAGDITGTTTYNLDTSGVPPMGAMLDGGSPPPPPPPPGGDPIDCFLVGPAQSNALNFGAGSAFKTKYLELAPGPRGVEFFNKAVGSSFLRKVSTYQHWDPLFSGNHINPAADDFKAFVQADPNRVAKGGIMYIGESCGATGREANTIFHITDAVDRIQHIRQRTGFATLPYVIVELHAQPSGYPYWQHVQFSLRMNCSDADGFGRVPDAYLVSAADLGGGVLHLGSGDLNILMERIATKFAQVLFP